MSKLCIICGNRAGSKEHVFPAALGGRRTNKGIYCGKHNQAFSPQASVMVEQLRLINARLSVRPDHSDEPTSVVFEGGEGESLVMSGDHIALASPQIVTAVTDGNARHVELRFANQRQADQWVAEQHAMGRKVQMSGERRQTIYRTDTQLLRMSYGGRELFRALAYVAMTFFAHDFPTLGRGTELSELKEYCLNDVGEDMAWWETPDLMSDLEQNPFSFGHTIAISISAEHRKAYARISLFSALNFSVFLGDVATGADRSIITFIDPLAERPPNDIIVRESERVLFSTDRPTTAHARLGEIIENGRAQDSFRQLFARISRYNFDRHLTPILDRIRGAAGDRQQLLDIATELVNEQGQRILNLMRHGITDLRNHFDGLPNLSFFASRLDILIAPDRQSDDGLNPQASAALARAKQSLRDEIVGLAERGEISTEGLFLLLSGGRGAALICEAVVTPLLAELASSPSLS